MTYTKRSGRRVAFCLLTPRDGRGAEVSHPFPLDGKSPSPNSTASAARDEEPKKRLVALKSSEQIGLASPPGCQDLFCCD